MAIDDETRRGYVKHTQNETCQYPWQGSQARGPSFHGSQNYHNSPRGVLGGCKGGDASGALLDALEKVIRRNQKDLAELDGVVRSSEFVENAISRCS